jgi:predicted nucleotidyltransferase
MQVIEEFKKVLQSKEVLEFIKTLNIGNMLVFGSVLTDEFNDNSDVDVAILGKEKLKLNDILKL